MVSSMLGFVHLLPSCALCRHMPVPVPSGRYRSTSRTVFQYRLEGTGAVPRFALSPYQCGLPWCMIRIMSQESDLVVGEPKVCGLLSDTDIGAYPLARYLMLVDCGALARSVIEKAWGMPKPFLYKNNESQYECLFYASIFANVAFCSMNSRRGATSSPISMEKT